MTSFDWRLIEAAFAAGVLWIRDKYYRKDLIGVGNKVRDLERKRLKDLALEIEIHAEEPAKVKRLAKHLYDTV